ncbi:MAG: hypothetical protein ABS62_05705 [Microbacterium sp. SCN 70-200]|uniref:DNA/RNA non-specific endonuclease n=1 Tax=unclassified Microbacterium TaxID=2609290 RepID=UPI000869D9F8|nr:MULTISPECIES: DNA/RNA non-specific endonuclease [unclassified Microbacterium]MBN9213498.1 DNA/RNA non-specific endonuclease [Microbacterium sp.]ODT41680.1 MAG: hypothetical protein ABS62_05705 [Microbacterium sp. SCN 70-200]OJV85129.1 MAG: hypothetical protein BGO46_11150 [Microbacterium sp. 70-16]
MSEVRPDITVAATGFDVDFLGTATPLPALTEWAAADTLRVDGSEWLDYTHFSLSMSRSRRLARVVAWNIDGATLKDVSRSGIPFRPDPRIPESAQFVNDLYANNDLDRGHVARRADLTWEPGAGQANRDSFYFTNITPQLNDFNQASRGGLWGRLEDDLLAEARLTEQRISVFGGPLLTDADPVYRDAGIPTAYWKMFVYRIDGELRLQGFLLRQNLDRLETSAFPTEKWAMYAYSTEQLRVAAGVDFGAYTGWERARQAAVGAAEWGPLSAVEW